MVNESQKAYQRISFSNAKVSASDQSKAVCVLDGLEELATQNLTVGVRRQVKEVEAGVSNRQISLIDIHWLNYHLYHMPHNDGHYILP